MAFKKFFDLGTKPSLPAAKFQDSQKDLPRACPDPIKDINVDSFVYICDDMVENYMDLSLKERERTANGRCCSGPIHQTAVMAVGKPRNGKSSVLNNIFGLHLDAALSVKPVTRCVSVTETEREGELFKVLDTPGLGSLELSDVETLKAMKCATQGTKFTLMYCFSVSPNTLLDETDKAIVQQLHTCLGEDVWKNCILLMTFSDIACKEINSEALYVEHIKSHAQEFQDLLRSFWKESPSVTTVFDIRISENFPEIIAIPVMKRTKLSTPILPGILKGHQDWTNVVINEIRKKTSN